MLTFLFWIQHWRGPHVRSRHHWWFCWCGLDYAPTTDKVKLDLLTSSLVCVSPRPIGRRRVMGRSWSKEGRGCELVEERLQVWVGQSSKAASCLSPRPLMRITTTAVASHVTRWTVCLLTFIYLYIYYLKVKTHVRFFYHQFPPPTMSLHQVFHPSSFSPPRPLFTNIVSINPK